MDGGVHYYKERICTIKYILIGIIAIVILVTIGGLNLWPSLKTNPPPQVATDPKFPEVKGQLLPGFPDFPVYPGASLVASSQTSPAGQVNTGYRAKWLSHDNLPTIMNWYLEELPKNGWTITEPPSDPDSPGEQIAHIIKGNLAGHIAAEAEGTDGEIEIVVDLSYE